MAKLTKAQKREIERLQGHSMIETRTAEGVQFSLDDGSPIHETIARNLIRSRIVLPADGGLFPGEAQTYRLPA